MSESTASVDWHGQLVEQLDWHWRVHARPRLDGLTDDEYRWEPVAECWNMRPRGTGTIAWRLAHLTVGVFGARAASHFGGRAFDYQTYDYPWAAEPAL